MNNDVFYSLTQANMMALNEALEIAIWADGRAATSWNKYIYAKEEAKALAFTQFSTDASTASVAKTNVARLIQELKVD